MFDFHEKRKIRSWLFSYPVIALILVLSFFLALSVHERYEKERETAAKRAERAAELDALRERTEALETQVAFMQSERGIEEEIRSRYDAVREGERMVVIVPNEASVASPTARREMAPVPLLVPEPERSFFSRLLFWR